MSCLTCEMAGESEIHESPMDCVSVLKDQYNNVRAEFELVPAGTYKKFLMSKMSTLQGKIREISKEHNLVII